MWFWLILAALPLLAAWWSSFDLLVVIDGNIGAGKSTLMNKLQATIPGAHAIPEPIKKWQETKDSNGLNILGAFDVDTKAWAVLFQIFAFVTRLEVMAEAYQSIHR